MVEADGTSLAVLRPLTEQEQERVSAEGLDQATLARTRVVRFQKVRPGRDYGTTLEILSGLGGGESVVVDPGDAVKEGVLVQIAGNPKSSVKSQ